MAQKEPYVSEPTDPSSGRPATFIFLHGYGDDAQGTPLGTTISLYHTEPLLMPPSRCGSTIPVLFQAFVPEMASAKCTS